MTVRHDRRHDTYWMDAGRLAFVALYGVALVAAGAWALSNVREVKAESRVVVVRFGAFQRVEGAGLLVAWPRPFEEIIEVPAAERVLERPIETLLRSPRAPQGADVPDFDGRTTLDDALAGSGFLLTGDAGVVRLDVRVFYKVTDPYAYALQQDHVIPALERAVARSAVRVCAARDLDTILVARPELVGSDSDAAERRERLRSDLVRETNAALADLRKSGSGLGIEVVRADVQTGLPAGTIDAFNSVLTSSQQADRGVAEARTVAAGAIQAATQAADRRVEDARAEAAERLSKARADTSTVVGLTQAMKSKAEPELWMRVYRERIPSLLARAGSVTLVDPKDESRLIIQGH